MGFPTYEGELRLVDIVDGLKDGLLNISFANSLGNGVYPVEIKQINTSTIDIEMSDESHFRLEITDKF